MVIPTSLFICFIIFVAVGCFLIAEEFIILKQFQSEVQKVPEQFPRFCVKLFLNPESAHINDTATKEDDFKMVNDQFQRGFY